MAGTMSFLPIVERELRAAARHPSNYGLRLFGAGAAVIALGLAGCRHTPAPGRFVPGLQPFGEFGAALFGYLNGTLFFLIWTVVPLMTADCLSRERREGTLGLLFLTPLSGRAVVIGKSLAQGLRAWTTFFAALPMLALPLFLGGVSWKDLALALLLDLAAFELALAAGLAASCLARERTAVILTAELLSWGLATCFVWAHARGFAWVVGAPRMGAGLSRGLAELVASLGLGMGGYLSSAYDLFAFATDFGVRMMPARAGLSSGGRWTQVWMGASLPAQQAWFTWAGTLLVAGGVFLAGTISAAAWRVRGWWRETPGPEWWRRGMEQLGQPLWRPAAAGQSRRWALHRSPVGWLQGYATGLRLSKWGWCLGVVVAEAVLGSHLSDLCQGQRWVGLTLLLGLAFSAAASFARERDTGALELLLVTPLRPSHLINGRVWGLWRQFGPAFAVLAGVWLFLRSESSLWGRGSGDYLWPLTLVWPTARGFVASLDEAAVYALGSVLILPVCGLHYAMRHRALWRAWLAAVGLGLILPPLLCRVLLRQFSEMEFLLLICFALTTVWYAFRPPRTQRQYWLWPAFLFLVTGAPWVGSHYVLPAVAAAARLRPDVIKLFLVQLVVGGMVWRWLHHSLVTRRFDLVRPHRGE